MIEIATPTLLETGVTGVTAKLFASLLSQSSLLYSLISLLEFVRFDEYLMWLSAKKS